MNGRRITVTVCALIIRYHYFQLPVTTNGEPFAGAVAQGFQYGFIDVSGRITGQCQHTVVVGRRQSGFTHIHIEQITGFAILNGDGGLADLGGCVHIRDCHAAQQFTTFTVAQFQCGRIVYTGHIESGRGGCRC